MNTITKKTKVPAFYLEVRGNAMKGVRPEGKVKDFINGSKEHFYRIADVIELASESLVDKLSKINKKPKECTIEFGISAEGETGIPLVTKGTIGADFKVTLKWEF